MCFPPPQKKKYKIYSKRINILFVLSSTRIVLLHARICHRPFEEVDRGFLIEVYEYPLARVTIVQDMQLVAQWHVRC